MNYHLFRFESPFLVSYKIFKELRFENLSFRVGRATIGNSKFFIKEFDFSKLIIESNANISYNFEICENEDGVELKEEFIIEKVNIVRTKTEITKQEKEKLLKIMFDFYFVIECKKLDGKDRNPNLALSKCLNNNSDLIYNRDGKIIDKKTNNSIYLQMTNKGYYYFVYFNSLENINSKSMYKLIKDSYIKKENQTLIKGMIKTINEEMKKERLRIITNRL